MQASPCVDTAGFRCWAEIDREALRHNARVTAELAGGAGAVIAVVKADAYGHGLDIVAPALCGEVGAFAVACVREAVDLESTLTTHAPAPPPVYLLSPALPADDAEIVSHGFIPGLSTLDEVARFEREAAGQRKSLAVHVVLDTGMGRMGALPSEADALVEAVRRAPHLTLDSVASHFPSSDEDSDFTRRQEASFRALTAGVRESTHLANSAGILHYPRVPGERVRAGLMLYGISPLPQYQARLRPAMTWKTRVSLVRTLPEGHGVSYGRAFVTPRAMPVATASAGYGDGYPRQLSGVGASVLIRGVRCPILGRVTMDQLMIDPTPAGGAQPGDEVVLTGTQGGATIDAWELSRLAGTVPWHLFTGITGRTLRRAK